MTYTPSTINVGSAPNDNTGDLARTAFQKVNSNFTNAATALNSITNVTALTDPGAYTTSQDRNLDWIVVARNLTSTYRMSVSELTSAYVVAFPTAGTFTYNVPLNATCTRIYCIGGGGGGGGGSNAASGTAASGGAGGGGGAFCEAVMMWQPTLLNTSGPTYNPLTVVVGAGGAGGAGKANGTAGNGTAGSNGGASYVYDTVTGTYYAYANPGLGGSGGVTGGATSTGGNGGSWLPTVSGSTIAGTFAAGNGDTITNNIVNPWCGGPGTGSSQANGSPTASAITVQGSPGGAGGGSMVNGTTIKAPGNIGYNSLYSLNAAIVTPRPAGGVANLSGNGGNGGVSSGYGYGWGGNGGGATTTAFTAGTGSAGTQGLVVIISTF